MDRRSVWLTAMALAVLSVILAPVNIWLATTVQGEGQAMAQHRAFIQQTPQLGRVVEVAASSLARAAMRDNDAAVKGLLAKAGITIQASAPSPAAAAVPAPVPPPGPPTALLPGPVSGAGSVPVPAAAAMPGATGPTPATPAPATPAPGRPR